MPRTSTLTALALLAALAAGPAGAAPVAVTASLRIEMIGLVPFVATGGGTIDVTGGVYQIPAGLVSLPSLTIPNTATTAVNSLVASGIANLAGTFAPGGVTSQVPSEVCLAPPNGRACVSGGGLGGIMPLTGLINIHVIPHIVVIPHPLGVVLGQGGSTNVPYTMDGAPWTTGTALINNANQLISTVGTAGTGSLTLVTGTYVLTCGNLLPVIARLTLTPLVPEPAGLALIVLGALGLSGLALRRP